MVGKGTSNTKGERARIIMEVLFSSLPILEACRKFNGASYVLYKFIDEFTLAHTTKMEHCRSILKASITREINELNGIIGKLARANETLKKL